jgi:hypothetical protein
MVRQVILVVVLGLFLTSCSNLSSIEGAGIVDAKVTSYHDEYQSGTLEDSNGDMWAICHTELNPFGKYVIVYDKHDCIIALFENGKLVLGDEECGGM